MEEVLKPTPNPEEILLLLGLEKLRQSIVEYSLRSHTLRKIPKSYLISWGGKFVCCEIDISFIWGKCQVRDHHKLSFPGRHLPTQINNRNIKTKSEIFSKLTMKTPERRQWQCLYC